MELRDEIRAQLQVRTAEPAGEPVELRRLARAALRRMHARPPGFEAEDLVNGFLAELLERGRAVQDDLLSFEDDRLEAAVRNRLRQLAVEAAPQWGRYRALKGHVTAVLDDPALAPSDSAAPVKLTEGRAERLSRDLVRKAVASALATPPPPPREAGLLTTLLMRRYFPPTQPEVGPHRDLLPSSAHRIRGDAAFLARTLRNELPPRQLQTLLRAYDGQTLQQIADGLGIAVATAWDLKQRAIGKIRALMAQHRITTDRTVAKALAALAEDPKVRRLLGFYDA